MLDLDPLVLSRFWDKVIRTGNCWEWISAKNTQGYGEFSVNGKSVRAHRFSYELLKEDIPKGLVIDHLCRNPSCVNPNHMETVTPQTNIKRGNAGKYFSSKTHCPKGHEYTVKNIYRIKKNNGRACRECTRIRARIWRESHREQIKQYNKMYKENAKITSKPVKNQVKN